MNTQKCAKFVCRNIGKIYLSLFGLCAVLTACGVTPNTLRAAVNPCQSEEYLEDHHATAGMFFSSANVVEEYEYDDAYCLLYDDADANMFNVEICVDLETYQLVIESIKNGKELVGTLVLNDDYSTEEYEVFTYMAETEFEMAEASAKM